MGYKIPLFKLNFDHQEEDSLIETLRSQWISTGPQCLAFEKAFSEALQIPFALTLSSCTSALHLAMLSLGLKTGDEVICPSLTFAATVNAIRYVNANPVFCDICSIDNLNIDPKNIRSLISSKTKAIIVVHYAGFPCRMDEIMGIARQHNLKVIEDASHAPLAEFNGRKLGTFGDIGCFSFFSNKNISTGEGGMFVTDDETVFRKAQLLRSHGMTSMSYERATGHATEYDIVELGYNYRLDDMRASIGRVQLNKLPDNLNLREKVRTHYLERLCEFDKISVPFAANRHKVTNYIMPIVLKNSDRTHRDALRQFMAKEGIQTSVHYPSVHRFSIYHNYKKKLPLTEYASDNEISLPMFAELKEEEVDYICERLISFYSHG